MTSPKTDITTRADIERLINAFYGRVRSDDLVGFIFNDIAQTDWEHHLPRMYDFWESILFRTGSFRGNPLAVHARLVEKTTMGKPQFDRWLQLFCATVDEIFAGENAVLIKNSTAGMAAVIHRKINHLPDPVFVPRPFPPVVA